MNSPSDLGNYQLPVEASEATNGALKAYLVRRGLATASETLWLERAGESNMNCVWRAHLPGRSIILKQARPWVEKFPSIAAPVERAEAEARFYSLTGHDPVVAARMPRLIHHDPDAHLLVLTDLAPVVSLQACYTGEHCLDVARIDDLARWLDRLHRLEIPAADAEAFRNRSMRVLNHAHIFDLPLHREGPFDGLLDKITPGLSIVARELRADTACVTQIAALGRRFLNLDQPSLVHGDFFLGSMLLTPNGEVRIIDPEFSFGGDPEFDLGIFYAHLILSGQDPDLGDRWLEQTMRAGDRNLALVRRYAGVEIIRRLIGVAQLPLELALAAKRELLERGRKLVCE